MLSARDTTESGEQKRRLRRQKCRYLLECIMKRHSSLIAILAILTLLIAACGVDPAGGSTPSPAADLNVQHSLLRNLLHGESHLLRADVDPQNQVMAG